MSEFTSTPETRNRGGARYLVVVAREQPDLLAYLDRRFADNRNVQVFADRRQGDRRQRREPREPERRRFDRRRQAALDRYLRTIGFFLTQRYPTDTPAENYRLET